jgi:hypothetical protein
MYKSDERKILIGILINIRLISGNIRDIIKKSTKIKNIEVKTNKSIIKIIIPLIFGYLYINIENGTKNINTNITTTIISIFFIVHSIKITEVNENIPQITEII